MKNQDYLSVKSIFLLFTILMTIVLLSFTCFANVMGKTQWTLNGVRISQNWVETCYDDYPWEIRGVSSYLDGSGGELVAFGDRRSGISTDIYVQKVNSTGAAIWTVNGVRVTNMDGWNQEDPQVVSDGAGGAIVVWQDMKNGNYDIYAQKVASAGTVSWTTGGAVVCAATGDQKNPKAIPDGAGGAIIAWTDNRNGNYDIFAQRINSSGSRIWTTDGVTVCVNAEDQRYPCLASSESGAAILAWVDMREGQNNIRAQKLNASGAVLWLSDGALAINLNYLHVPALVSNGSGGAIIVSMLGTLDIASGNGGAIPHVVALDSTGTWLYSPKPITSWDYSACNANIRIVQDGSGGAIISWEDDKLTEVNNVYMQRVNPSGTFLWTANGVKVSSNTANDLDYYQLNHRLTGGNGGDVLVCWTSRRYDLVGDLFAQKINTSGVKVWGRDSLICGIYDQQSVMQIVTDGSSGAIMSWIDTRSGANGSYVQRVVDYTDNVLPVVTVNTPNTPITLESGTAYNISWTATDDNGFPPASYISIYYSPNNGAGWTQITSLEQNDPSLTTGSYSWTVPSIGSNKFLISIEAYDNAMNRGCDISNSNFTVLAHFVQVSLTRGSDITGEGTLAKPYKTIQKGLNWVTSESLVSVEAGTYNENGILWPSYRGVTLRGAGPNLTTIEAQSAGRGISVEVAVPLTIEALSIKNGSVVGIDGGAINLKSGSSLRLKQVVLSQNGANRGGAVYSVASVVTAEGCSFIQNSCGSFGGVGYGGTWEARNCLFFDNFTNDGGGVFSNLFLKATNCDFISNETTTFTGDHHGAVAYLLLGTVEVADCTFKYNVAKVRGGVAYAGSWKATNCVFINNGAYTGGVGCVSSWNFINCTIYGNGDASGGGVVWSDTGNVVNVTNSILWNNSTTFLGVTGTAKYNDIQGGTGILSNGGGNINVNPIFASTSYPYDMHLSINSPCVNTGTFEGASDHDLDGKTRPIPANPPLNHKYFDMGCYEQKGTALVDDVYVAVTGNNTTGEGTFDSPYQTIAYGLTQVASAGVVHVATGEYREHDIQWPNRSNITLRGAGSNETIISGEALGRVISVEAALNLTIEALTIRQGSLMIEGNGGGIYLAPGSKLYLRNMKMLNNGVMGSTDYTGCGGAVYSGASRVYAFNCLFDSNTANHYGGVGFSGSWEAYDSSFNANKGLLDGGVFCGVVTLNASRCVFSGNNSAFGGVFTWVKSGMGGPDSKVSDCIISNNSANDGGVSFASHLTFINCRIFGNTSISGSSKVFCWGENDEIITWINCTIYGNTGVGSHANTNWSGKNCIMWNNGTPFNSGTYEVTYSDVEGGRAGTGNINSNPLFLNASGGDFHVLATSECVNSGTFEGAPDHDLDGNPRPLPANAENKYYDMGCYEQAGTTAEVILVEPNGSEKLYIGTFFDIVWKIKGLVTSDAYIRLSTNEGSSWDYLITHEPSVLGVSTYEWTVPNLISKKCLISVEAFGPNGWGRDKSDGVFEISESVKPVVTVEAPNGGEVLAGGSAFNVTWKATDNYTLNQNLIIKIYFTSGEAWQNVATTTESPSGSGLFMWPVPSGWSSTECRIRITASDEVGNIGSDESNSKFTIDSSLPSVTVLRPAIAEVLLGGSQYIITWEATDKGGLTTEAFTIWYSLNNGASWTQIASSISSLETMLSWNVPSVDTTEAYISVEAVDRAGNRGYGTSGGFVIDGAAPIVTVSQPNGGEVLLAGITYEVMWNASDSGGIRTDGITIRYSTDGGASWSLIEGGLSNSGSYYWIPPVLSSATCKISIEAMDVVGRTGSDMSNGNFIILKEPGGLLMLDKIVVNQKRYIDGDVISPSGVMWVYFYSDLPMQTMTLEVDGGYSFNFNLFSREGTYEAWLGNYSVLPIAGQDERTFTYNATVYAGYPKVAQRMFRLIAGGVQTVGVPLNYPNPFKPLSGGSDSTTRIQYTLSDNAQVVIVMYDITGQEVKRWEFTSGQDGGKAGINSILWDGKSLFGEVVGNGMYIYKITSGGRTIGTGKLVVLD